MVGKRRRAGRCRKANALRHPGGQLVRGDEDARHVALAQPHRRGWGVGRDKWGKVTDKRLDQRAESPLGRLCLAGRITRREYDAGRRFATIVARYRAVISAPDPLGQRIGGSGIPISDGEARERKEAYDEMFRALADAGHKSQRAVSRACVYGEAAEDMDALRRGLSTLVEFFFLTPNRKSPLLK